MSLLSRRARRPEHWPWRRLWLPRDVTPPLDSAGFLRDASWLRLIGVPEPVSLDVLANVPCVVALGDPDMGKSCAIQDYAEAVSRAVPAENLLAVDLVDYASRDELLTHVFRASVVEAWSGPGAPVHLILDSLDESPLQIETVCGIILEEVRRLLQRISRERLRLLIACRTAVMPPYVVKALRSLFTHPASAGDSPTLETSPADSEVGVVFDGTDAEGCVVFEIAVLRREDAHAAAASFLGDQEQATAFLRSVVDANVGHFAARPVTLRALLLRHRAGRPLGGSQADLYRELCRELSGSSSARPGAGLALRAPSTTRDQRYRVAGRLAASLLFGNLRGVWCGEGPPPSTELLDPRECDGVERFGGLVLSVDAAAATREALNTALFTGGTGDPAEDATGGVVAAHQTFAEFLAADWVLSSGMDLLQVLSLLYDPTDPEQRVVPQLRQVAAWLASMRTDVLGAVATHEPELLLASDVVHVPEASRVTLVALLLQRAGDNRFMRPSFGDRLSYDLLNHPGLSQQLAPILEDQQRPIRVRHLALEIARACRLESLTALSTEIALDSGESLDLRSAAAAFVADSGTEPDRLLLMPLVAEPPAEDEAEELRGAALWASWKLFTPDELFTMITRPRRSNWSGAYAIALREVAAGMDDEYVVDAARWLAGLSPGSSYGAYNDIVEATLCTALKHVDDDRVRAPLLTHIRRRLRSHVRLGDTVMGKLSERLEQVLTNFTNARRRLVTALFDGEHGWPPPNVDLTTNVAWLGLVMPELFSGADVSWALDVLASLPAEDVRRATWREAIRIVFRPLDDTHLDAALQYRVDADVAYATSEWSTYATREAASEALASAQQRAQEAEIARAALEQSEPTDEVPHRTDPLGERITKLLSTPAFQNVGEEDVGATPKPEETWAPWAHVYFELALDPHSGRTWRGSLSRQTLDELNDVLGPEQLRVLVDAALAYLNNEYAETDPYPPGGGLTWRTAHGGAAALFVARFAPDRLSEVSALGWREWLFTLVQYTSYNEEMDFTLLGPVFAAAERTAHEALRDVLRDATDASLRDSRRRVNAVARRLAVATVPVAEELARRAGARAFPPLETRYVLSELLREGGAVADAARKAAAQLLAVTPSTRLEGDELTGHASSTEVDGATDRGAGGDEVRPAGASLERAACIAAAAALIAGDEDAGWAIIGTRLRDDRAFAREVLLFAAEREQLFMSGVMDRLSSERLSDIYQIVQREFPPESDPWHDGVYSPGPNDVIRQWRSTILTALENRATADAVDALARIAAASPERDWLVQVWLRAKVGLMGARWTGTPPRALMAMAQQPHLRQVQSGEQLLDVLTESLERLQRELQGELRSVVGLWDQQRPRAANAARQARGRAVRPAPSKWLPKDEGHLANEIARHLRRDLAARGVIVGRELVVQVGIPGGAAGLRTDLDVRARPVGESAGSIPDIRVIIEVKGSWNREVWTAMQTQLVEDYLDPHHVHHGMYLVGEYTCDAWEDSPEKRRSARIGGRAKLTHSLSEQASSLSNPLRQVRAVVLDVSLPANEPRSLRGG